MLNTEYSFNKYLSNIVETKLSSMGFTFYPEPNYEKIKYTAITVLHDDCLDKTDLLHINQRIVEVHILTIDYQKNLCDRASQVLLRDLELTNDNPGSKRRIPKYRYVDDDGQLISPPERILNSDVLYYLSVGLQRVEEPSRPELMHNTFSLKLMYRAD